MQPSQHLRRWWHRVTTGHRALRPTGRRARPRFELLEDRAVPSASLFGDTPTWSDQGPGPIRNNTLTAAAPDNRVAGAIETFVTQATPGSPDGDFVVYAGTVNGGVWRCNNIDAASPANVHWTPLTDRTPSLGVSSLALDPTDASGNTLYVGTGSLSSVGRGAGGPPAGILVTHDGGSSWSVVGQHDLAGKDVLSLVVLPPAAPSASAPRALVVAAYDGAGGGGLLRSQDGGQTFQPVNEVGGGALTGDATDVVVDPDNNHVLYAALPARGIFRSIDGGATWSSIGDGIAGISQPHAGIKLAVHGGGPQPVLYAGLLDAASNLTGVYRAMVPDTGEPSWAAVGAAPVPPVQTLDVRQFTLAADPRDANVVYVGGYAGILYSADSANNAWTLLYVPIGQPSPNQPHGDVRHLGFLTNDALLESDDGGLFGMNSINRPMNPAVTPWVALSGDLGDTELYRVAYDTQNGLVLGAAQDNATAVQAATNRRAWDTLPGAGGDGSFVAVDNRGPAAVYYYQSDGIGGFDRDVAGSPAGPQAVQLASSLGGPQFSGLNPADQALAQTAAPFPFVLNRVNSGRMLIANAGVYESRVGPSGNPILTGDVIDNVTPAGMTGNVSALAYGAPEDPNFAIVGTNSGQLFVRTGSGPTFVPLNVPWGVGTSALAIVLAPDDFRTLYVLDSSGHVRKGVFATLGNTASATWTDLTGNLGQVCTRPFALEVYDPTPGGQLGDEVPLVGGFGGVFRRLPDAPDPGWTRFGFGLPDAQVEDLHYIPPVTLANGKPGGDLLLVGTLGRGAWTVPDAGANLTSAGASVEVDGDDNGRTNDRIILRLDPADPSRIQVLVNDQLQFEEYYTLLSDITIDGGTGWDTILVEDVPAGVPVTVIEGGVGSKVDVGKDGSVRGIKDTLTIETSLSTNSVHIHASADHSPGTVTLDRATDPDGDPVGRITGLAPGTIQYQVRDTRDVTIEAPDATTFNVLSTQVPVTIDVQGSDAVNVGDDAHSLDGLHADLTVDGQESSAASLQIDDQTAAQGHTYTVDAGQVTRLGGPTIHYSAIGSLVVTGSGHVNTFNVQATPAGTPVRVNGGAGTGNVNVGTDDRPSLDGIQGALALDAPGCVLRINDQGSGAGYVYTITAAQVSRPGSAPITYYAGAPLVVSGAARSDTPDTYNVQSTAALTPLSINDTAGNSTVNVGGVAPAGSLNALGGTVTVTVPNGLLNVNDQLTTAGQTYDVTAATVTRHGSPDIVYLSAGKVVVHGAQGGNAFNVTGTHAGTPVEIDDGPGAGTITVGTAGTKPRLDLLAADLTVQAPGDVLTINDQGAATGHTYDVAADSVHRDHSATIHYPAADTVVVNGSKAGGDVFHVTGTHVGTPVTINDGPGGAVDVGDPGSGLVSISGILTVHGGGTTAVTLNDKPRSGGSYTLTTGSVTSDVAAAVDFSGLSSLVLDGAAAGAADVFTLASKPPAATAVYLVGGPGHNLLRGDNAVNTWHLTGINAGRVGNVHFRNIQNLHGGTLDDTFQFSDGGGVTGMIDGEGGINTLDYTLYTHPVVVNLARHQATGTGGVVHFQKVLRHG
jgi:hypothetical protein